MTFSNPLVGGNGALIREAIQSADFVSGISGWQIRRDGSAEFNNVLIRGTLQSSNYDSSNPYVIGWKLATNGTASFQDVGINVYRGDGVLPEKRLSLEFLLSKYEAMGRMAAVSDVTLATAYTTTTTYTEILRYTYTPDFWEELTGWINQQWKVRAYVFVQSNTTTPNDGQFLGRIKYGTSSIVNTASTQLLVARLPFTNANGVYTTEWSVPLDGTWLSGLNNQFISLEVRNTGTVPYTVGNLHTKLVCVPVG